MGFLDPQNPRLCDHGTGERIACILRYSFRFWIECADTWHISALVTTCMIRSYDLIIKDCQLTQSQMSSYRSFPSQNLRYFDVLKVHVYHMQL